MEITKGFMAMGFLNCIGALDSTHICVSVCVCNFIVKNYIKI